MIFPLVLFVVMWLLWAALAWYLHCGPRDDAPESGIFWRLAQLHARALQRVRVEGLEHLPRSKGSRAGPLILISNHTAGVDPVLLQAACPFEIRWVMAADMRLPAAEPLWQWMRIIFVDRTGKDASGMREAIRHVQQGGVLGIFPEGGIERPPRALKPFQPGIGLIIRKTQAPVLPAVIDGTFYAPTAWGSILRRARARVRFMPPRRLDHLKPDEIARELERLYQSWTGWPMAPSDPVSPMRSVDPPSDTRHPPQG